MLLDSSPFVVVSLRGRCTNISGRCVVAGVQLGAIYLVSLPSIAKIADFLFFLRKDRQLSVATVWGFRATLSSVFKFILPEVSDSVLL